MATPAFESAQVTSLPKVSTLKEGYLLKRQRGQSQNADLRRLKFQQRYICLTQDALHYYVDQKKGEKKGEFPVDRMRIIEKVPDSTFQKPFCFQIGDEKEIMYFKVKSESERRDWLETFRIASTLKGNFMLDHYHYGAYGQVHQQRWSCCNAANRDSQGCQRTIPQTNGSKQHRRTTSMKAERQSPSKLTRRPFSERRSNPRSDGKERSPSPAYHDAKEEHTDNDPSPTSQSLVACTSPLSQFEAEGETDQSFLMRQDSQSSSLENTLEDSARDRMITDAHRTRIRSPDCTSIDSGYGIGSTFGGSRYSLISGPGISLSPSAHQRLNMQHIATKETIPEHKPHLSNEYRGQGKQPSTEKRESPWKFKDLRLQNCKSKANISAFRGTDTLITAHRDGTVQKVAVGKLDETAGVTELLSSSIEGSVDSLDVWKNYVLVGSQDLKLVNIDKHNSRNLLGSREGQTHSHIAVFTPRGQPISYNRSQPGTIKIWPKVDAIDWSASAIKVERELKLNDSNLIKSLAVSPNPSLPRLAVTKARQLQIYDYEAHTLTSQLDVDDGKTVSLFSPTGKYFAVASGRDLQIYDTESSTTIFRFPVFDVPITSLAYNPWPRDAHLAVGLSSGEIQVYKVAVPDSKPELLASLDQSMASAALASLAYSKDGRTLAAVDSNGNVKLWKVPVHSRRHQGVSLVRQGEFKVDSRGKQYISPDDGYVISVPPGAIAEGKNITFKHGVVPDGPFGPFEFPPRVRPVSAILSLHPTTDQPALLKPMDIALPHFIHCKTQEDCKRLAVFKAECGRDGGKDGQRIYSFKEVSSVNLLVGTYRGDPNYPEGIPYAKFSTDHHCYWCIGEYGKEDTDEAIFSLVEVKPKVLAQSEDPVIHFCLPYFLPTCHKTIREQYPEESYDLNIQSVKFSSDDSLSGDDQAIGIDFCEMLGGWLFSLQGGRDKKIYKQDVSFWDYPTPLYLKEMCHEKLYPPRFTVHIRGALRPSDTVVAEFKFPGTVAYPGRGQPLALLHLPLPTQRSSTSTGLAPVSRVNSGHSVMSETVFRAPASTLHQPASPLSQHFLQPAAQAFKACMCDLDELHPSKLAINLFSKNIIDETTFESIQESMKSPVKDEMVLRTEILRMVYNALKIDARLSTSLQQALKKLNPESAGKFASEMSRLSREGSVASTSSLATAPERFANETEAPPSDTLAHGQTNHLVNGSAITALSTFTPYSPINFAEDPSGMLTFSTQTSLLPVEPCSIEAQTESEESIHQETPINDTNHHQ